MRPLGSDIGSQTFGASLHHSQNERRRSASLARRCSCPHRRSSSSSAGRASALELDASISDLRSSSMTTHINKVHHVTAITKVAKDLGEDEDWLRDVANGMEIEDGAIWVIELGACGAISSPQSPPTPQVRQPGQVAYCPGCLASSSVC